jgi:hypothetical protein
MLQDTAADSIVKGKMARRLGFLDRIKRKKSKDEVFQGKK